MDGLEEARPQVAALGGLPQPAAKLRARIPGVVRKAIAAARLQNMLLPLQLEQHTARDAPQRVVVRLARGLIGAKVVLGTGKNGLLAEQPVFFQLRQHEIAHPCGRHAAHLPRHDAQIADRILRDHPGVDQLRQQHPEPALPAHHGRTGPQIRPALHPLAEPRRAPLNELLAPHRVTCSLQFFTQQRAQRLARPCLHQIDSFRQMPFPHFTRKPPKKQPALPSWRYRFVF